MKLTSKTIIAAALYLSSTSVLAADLAGFWKNDDQPGWIEIVVDEGVATATVRRNDKKPEAVGRLLLKDVVSDAEEPGNWRGQVYAERFKEYRDASISLPAPDRMEIKVKVGFISRTVSWTRVDGLPGE